MIGLALEKCAPAFPLCVLMKTNGNLLLFLGDVALTTMLKTARASIRLREGFPESLCKSRLLESFCQLVCDRLEQGVINW